MNKEDQLFTYIFVSSYGFVFFFLFGYQMFDQIFMFVIFISLDVIIVLIVFSYWYGKQKVILEIIKIDEQIEKKKEEFEKKKEMLELADSLVDLYTFRGEVLITGPRYVFYKGYDINKSEFERVLKKYERKKGKEERNFGFSK